MNGADEVREGVAPVTHIAMLAWRQLFLVVDHDCDGLDLVHDFDLREGLDETFDGFVAHVLGTHGEVESCQDNRADSWNCPKIHVVHVGG